MAGPKLRWDYKEQIYVPKGRRKKPGPKRKPRREQVKGISERSARVAEKKAALAAFIAAGIPKAEALVMAGYSAGNRQVVKEAAVVEAVQEMRDRLQRTHGYTLEDSADFYRRMSESEETKADTRIKARTRLDSLLGLDATKKVEVSETRELSMAIQLLSRLPSGTIDAAVLGQEVEAEIGEVEELAELGTEADAEMPETSTERGVELTKSVEGYSDRGKGEFCDSGKKNASFEDDRGCEEFGEVWQPSDLEGVVTDVDVSEGVLVEVG